MSNEGLQTLIAEEFREELEFANTLKSLSIRVAQSITHMGDSVTMASVLLTHYAIQTYSAIILLSKEGYGSQAFTLARSILEALINFKFILLDGNARSEQYLLYFAKEKYELFEAFKRQHGAEKIEEIYGKERLAEIEKDHENLKSRFKGNQYSYSWSGKHLREMAEKTGLFFYYEILYRILSFTAHSSPLGIQTVVEKRPSDDKVNLSYGPSSDLVGKALIFSSGPLIEFIDGFIGLYKLDFAEEIKSIKIWHDQLILKDLPP